MMPLMLSVFVGAGIGAALGHFGKCSGGHCPLTSTWWRGALYGAALGGAIFVMSGRGNSDAMNESTPNVKRVAPGQFQAEVLESTQPVVVDFYATWCGPCRRLAPMLEELAGQFSGRIKFIKVNVDEASALAQRFQVQGVPTLLFFDKGQIVESQVGLASTEALKARLEALGKMKKDE